MPNQRAMTKPKTVLRDDVFVDDKGGVEVTAAATLSMFYAEGEMGRRRGQRPSKGNPYKKGASWMVRWREDVLLADGSLARVRLTRKLADSKGPGAISKREADRLADEQVFSKLDAAAIRPQSMATVNQFLEARFRPNIVDKTRSPHYKNVLPHVARHLGTLKLRDVRPDDVYKLLRAMEAAGLAAQTIKHVLAAVRRVFRHAKELGYFQGDLPTEFVAGPKVRPRRRGALTPEQVFWIAEKMKPPYRQLVLLLATTGLRIGEAVGLRWKRVNLTAEARLVEGEWLPAYSLRVAETWTRNRWSEGKTESSLGLVPLPVVIAAELEAWRGMSRWNGADHAVFAVSRTGRPLEPSNAARKKLKPVLKQLDLSGEISWHWFRHTLASLADEAGMSEAERQAVLRHSDPAMTRHYTHTRLDGLRAGLELVAGRVMGSEKKGPGREAGVTEKRKVM